MSIGICDLTKGQARRLGLALVCCASLSACVGGEGFSFAPNGAAGPENSQADRAYAKSTQVTLARGAVKLKAPEGFCIDPASVSSGLRGSSAMLAKCSSLDGKGAGEDTAVMSVQISARRGSTATAPSGQDLINATRPRRTLQSKQKGDLALIQIATGGDEVFSAADPVHWRGATALNTRLVLLGLFAPKGSEIASDEGAELLASLARGISATQGSLLGLGPAASDASSETDAKNQAKDVSENSTTEKVEPTKKGGQGFIARLLNRS
ncbi:hypothetical protein [Planktotalea sp.]|uniref:hypothetical protein n=1 Tax=Planktotalea sp. TaxID=2029877 RepID=UPI003F6D4B2D